LAAKIVDGPIRDDAAADGTPGAAGETVAELDGTGLQDEQAWTGLQDEQDGLRHDMHTPSLRGPVPLTGPKQSLIRLVQDFGQDYRMNRMDGMNRMGFAMTHTHRHCEDLCT